MGLNFNSNFPGFLPGHLPQLPFTPNATTFGNLPRLPDQPIYSADAFTPVQTFVPNGSNGSGQQGGMLNQVLLPLFQSVVGMVSMMMPAAQNPTPQPQFQGYGGQNLPYNNPGFFGGERQPVVGQPNVPPPYISPQNQNAQYPGYNQQPITPTIFNRPSGGQQGAPSLPVRQGPLMVPQQQSPGLTPEEEIYMQGYNDGYQNYKNGYIDDIQDPLEQTKLEARQSEKEAFLTDGEARAAENVAIIASNEAAVEAIQNAGGSDKGLITRKGLKALAEADVKGDDKVWGKVKKGDRQGIQDATRVLLGYNNEEEASEAFDYAMAANGDPDSMDVDEMAEYSALYELNGGAAESTDKTETQEGKSGKPDKADKSDSSDSSDNSKGRTVEILKKGYKTFDNSGSLAQGIDDPSDYKTEDAGLANYNNDSDDTLTVSNADGMKNYRAVVDTSANDEVYFEGDGWEKEEGVTDKQSKKEGTLFTDDNGNQILVSGKGAAIRDGETITVSGKEQNKDENMYGSTPIGLGQGEDEGLFLYHPGGDTSKTAYARALGADVTVDGAPVYEIPGSGKRFTYNDAEREMIFVDKADQAKHEGSLSKVTDDVNKKELSDEKISNIMNDNQNSFEEGVLDANDEDTEMITLADWKAWADPEINERMKSVQTDANVRSQMRLTSQKVLDRIEKAKEMEPEAALNYLGHYKKEFSGKSATWQDLQDVASGKNLLEGVPEEKRENLRMAAAKVLYERITPGHHEKNDDTFGGPHKINNKSERYGKTDYPTIFNYLDNRDSNGGVGGGTNGDGRVDRDMFGHDSLSSTKDLSDERKKFWGIDWYKS